MSTGLVATVISKHGSPRGAGRFCAQRCPGCCVSILRDTSSVPNLSFIVTTHDV